MTGMKNNLPVLLSALVCGLTFTSCSPFQQQEKQPAAPDEAIPDIPPPLYLGTVHQVFSTDKFALLRIIGPLPTEGTVLITHPADGSADRIGNLIVSSAQHARNSIIAADIRAGIVMKGDRVFRYRNIAAQEEQSAEEPAEASTLSGTEIDLGYTPPLMKEKLESDVIRDNQNNELPPTAEEDTAATSILPDVPMPEPAHETPERNKFDDIPDNISDWDSM